jgi:hypothetical protein
MSRSAPTPLWLAGLQVILIVRFWAMAGVLIFFGYAWSSAQQNVTLSPVVRQFVKIDSPVIALTHARVIDGTGSPVRENQTIIISGDKIRAIGDSGATAIPAGAKVLDLAGYTVIPGLVGMHDHMYYPQPVNLAGRRVRGELQFEQQSSFTFPRLYLAAGVTSLRTTAGVEPYADLNLKTWIDAGKIPGPKLHVTGHIWKAQAIFDCPCMSLRDRKTPGRLWNFGLIRV